MALEMGVIAPHVPSICFEEKAPPYQRSIIDGMYKVSEMIDRINPDAVIVISCHWMTTFDHFVTSAPYYDGTCTSPENPFLISKVPYRYPGDPELGKQLVEAGTKAGLPVIPVENTDYELDYGTVVPLRYLTPKSQYPIISLPVTLCATLDEHYKWGQVIREVVDKSGKKVVFVASGALSHNLVRGRENMPTHAEMAMNEKFFNFVMNNDFKSAWEMTPQFSRSAGVESGGRHLASLLGALGSDTYKTGYFGFAQSSGSGNYVITFEKQ
mgnify:FL=1|jgi:3,4-dihydroxyphenylacetate 2,3-dioxygenase